MITATEGVTCAGGIAPTRETTIKGMKRLVSLILVTLVAAPLAGCIVRTGPARGPGYARSCPPAHHWEGGACVHNGRARGHYK